MSRMVQARVTDAQYDFLFEQAMEVYDGDLSQALRAAITFAMELDGVLLAPSPPDAFREMLARWEQAAEEARSSVRMDEADAE
jgi:hypothetical protein